MGDSCFHQHWHLHPQRAASCQPLWDATIANLNYINLKSSPGIRVSILLWLHASIFLPFQEDRRESKLTLRPPSLAAPYAPVQNWQHQPEKLIFESCGYEANVSGFQLLGLARMRRLWGQVAACGGVTLPPPPCVTCPSPAGAAGCWQGRGIVVVSCRKP